MSSPYSSFNPSYSFVRPTQQYPPPPPSSGPWSVPTPRQPQSTPPYPPTADPRGPPPRASQQASIPYAALARNDEVRVNIQGRGWAIGIVIAVLEAFERAGLKYTIKFLDPVAKTWEMRDFGADEVRPRSGRNE